MGGFEAERFADELARLKRAGCSILVVGTASKAADQRPCRRLLGEDSPSRNRILVHTDPGRDPGRRDDSLPADRTVLVRRRTRTRGATAAASTARPSHPTMTVDEPDLDALENAITLAIEKVATGTRAPADLRLCLDAIGPLIADSNLEAVEAFLSDTLDRIVAERGMAHAHLRVGHDHDVVQSLRSVFDVLVEVRPGTPPEQRWHVQDAELASAWLPLGATQETP